VKSLSVFHASDQTLTPLTSIPPYLPFFEWFEWLWMCQAKLYINLLNFIETKEKCLRIQTLLELTYLVTNLLNIHTLLILLLFWVSNIYIWALFWQIICRFCPWSSCQDRGLWYYLPRWLWSWVRISQYESLVFVISLLRNSTWI